MKASPLSFLVLEDLNVKPNVHYLARIRNTHPDVPAEAHEH